MATEEEQDQFKRSIVPESSLTRTGHLKNPKRYLPGFENSPGSKIKQAIDKSTDKRYLIETKEYLSGANNLSEKYLSGAEDLRRTKEHLTKTKGSCVTQKSKRKVTLKEVQHGVVNQQQPVGAEEEDVELTDKERVSRRR